MTGGLDQDGEQDPNEKTPELTARGLPKPQIIECNRRALERLESLKSWLAPGVGSDRFRPALRGRCQIAGIDRDVAEGQQTDTKMTGVHFCCRRPLRCI